MHPLLETLQPWLWIEEPLNRDPVSALGYDSELVKAIAMGTQRPVMRLWENPQCLVVTRRETRLPQYDGACQTLRDEGWPVLVRDSGGTAVPHGPGIVHFTLAFPQSSDTLYDLDQAYQALCEPLRYALSALGLNAVYGSVEGSYCDGRYNLVVEGLKITGTAQRVIASTAPGIKNAILAQAMLMVDSDAVAGTEVVNRFYRLAGDARMYNPTVSTSVKERLGGSTKGRHLTAEVRALIRQGLDGLIAPKQGCTD